MEYLIIISLFIFPISFYGIYKSWERQRIRGILNFLGKKCDKDTGDKFIECIEIINKNKECVR